MIKFYSYNKDNQTASVTKEKANWIHLEKPTTAEINELVDEYQFPQDYLTSVLDNQEISRQEGLQQQEILKPILLLLQYPDLGTSPSGFKQIECLPFSIILTPDIMITACNTHLDLKENLASPRSLDLTGNLQERLAIQLAWYFSNLFNYYIRGIKAGTEELESELLTSTENKQLYQLMDMQKSLVYFDSALQQNFAVLSRLYESELLMNDKNSTAALYDIMIETKQAISSADIQAQLIAQLGNMFSSIVSNNMNIVMKVLTVITIVLTIPTIIGGIYGMNVRLPFAEDHNMFWWLLIATILMSYLTIRWLKRKKFF